MKRILSLILVCLILCSAAVSVFAAQITENSQITAKYKAAYEGAYRAEVIDGAAEAGGVSVTGAPENALTLIVIPMLNEALSWIGGCVEAETKAAYDIHFIDADENRINADGVAVCLAASGDGLQVFSVTPDGAAKPLSSEAADGKVNFTADGSHYYALTKAEAPEAEKPVTVPVRGDENTVHADVTVSAKDTVKLHEMDFEEIDHVVGDHVDTGVVEIDLTALSGDVTKIVLPVATVEHIVEAAEEAHNDTEALQIDFPSGSVKLDDKAMRAMVEQAEGNEVMLVLENVGESRLNDTQENAVGKLNIYGGYEAYMVCVSAQKRISDFEGGVATLSVPFTVPKGLDADLFSVLYIADDGKIEKLDTHYADGRLIWDVSHFSDFLIIYEGDETEAPDIPQTGDDSGIFLWGALLVLSAAILLWLIKRRNKSEA